MPITNATLAAHQFLAPMYADGYYPNELVDKVRAVLLELCEQVEASPSLSLDRLYTLSHAATERINEIAPEFEEHDSELETVAREAIAAEFGKIAECYGFAEACSVPLPSRQLRARDSGMSCTDGMSYAAWASGAVSRELRYSTGVSQPRA